MIVKTNWSVIDLTVATSTSRWQELYLTGPCWVAGDNIALKQARISVNERT